VSAEPFDWPRYVDVMAALQGLPLNAERRTAVIQQLATIETLARQFTDFPLEPEIEPAPVFRP
jgi:hypothetical protein